MRRIKPHRASAPAKADDAEPIRIASLGLGPIDRRVEIESSGSGLLLTSGISCAGWVTWVRSPSRK